MPRWRLLGLVAAEETTRYFRGFNRRVLLFILAAAVVGSVLVPFIIDRGIVPDEKIYRAEVTPASPLEPALRASRQFEVHEGVGGLFLQNEVDLFVLNDRVFYQNTERGIAAANDFATFAERYFDGVLRGETNQSAAFPVYVNIVYQPRALSAQQLAQGAPVGDEPSGNFSQPTDSFLLQEPGEKELGLTPGAVEAPFPMESLLLTFVYLVPLNFVGQYYAGSLLGERTRSRGVLLLAAPLTGAQILLAKTAPYLGFSILFSLVATLFLGGGLIGFVATLPIFTFFLAATCLAALVARSYRELTFFITTMSVALSTYLFLPAIFTQVHPIAYISPISAVAASIRGEAVPTLSLLYSMTPLTLAAIVLGAFATALYREESLFAPRPIFSKLLDAINQMLPRRWSFLLAGVLVLPFVFGAELIVLAFAASFRIETAIGLFLVGVAVVEELAKAVPALAHFRRARTPAPPLVVGLLVGTGFFLGEKLGLLFSLVGLGLVPLGDTLLTTYGITTSLLLVVGPWFLHVVTATLTAYGARARNIGILLALPLAILVHVAYNWMVIRIAT